MANEFCSQLVWLDRDTVLAPYLILAGTEDIYREACDHRGDKWPSPWIKPGSTACTHTYHDLDKITCIVCIDIKECITKDQVVVIGNIVHESVHVAQELFGSIGEKNPSNEFEAYVIDKITQRLLYEYIEQKKALNERAEKKS